MINISDFNRSLKLSWIKRLLTTEGSWQTIFQENVGVPKHMVFEMDQRSLKEIVANCTNPFWRDVIEIWRNFKIHLAEDIDSRTYPLWGTFFIKNKNLVKRSTEMIRKGVKYVNDLLVDMGQLYGYSDFKQKYDIEINFVDFYSMTHSIPREYLQKKS